MRTVIFAGLLAVTLLWNGTLLLAPVATHKQLAAAVYAGGSLICHQRADRSFHLGAAQLPVCARCFGLYLGATLGVLAWWLVAGNGGRREEPALQARTVRQLRRALLLTAAPSALTLATAWLGLWDPGNLVRAATALPLGASIAAIAAAAAAGDVR